VDVNFHDDDCRIIAPDGNQVLHAVKHRGQYELQLARSTNTVTALTANHASKYNDDTLKLWHRRTGHLGMDDLKRLAGMAEGITLATTVKSQSICGPCMKGRQTRKPSKQPQELVTGLLGCIDSDVGDPITPQAIGGKKYFVLFTDRASGCCWGYLLTLKSDVFDIFTKEFKPLVETQTGCKIKRWRTDHGTEVENKAMDVWAKAQGIKWKPSAPYSPEQNGISERQNRTIVEKIRAMLADASLPSHMWGEMLFTSVYLRNRSPAARLRLRGIQKTPYEVWYGKKPNLSHLRIVGCDAWHHVSKELPGQKKLSERAIKCRLLHQKVKVGIDWEWLYQTQRSCPIHGQFFTIYHIWIECSVAEAVWQEMKDIWEYLSTTKAVLPHTVPELIAYMALCPVHAAAGTGIRRWQVLYQTAVWALWKAYLSHSFAQPHVYWNADAAIARYKELVKTRILGDRTLSVQERHRNKHYNAKIFKELWGQWPNSIHIVAGPRCLSRPIMAPTTDVIDVDDPAGLAALLHHPCKMRQASRRFVAQNSRPVHHI